MITPRVLFLLAHGAAHLEHYLPPMRTLDVLDFDYLRFIPRRIRFAFPWVHLFVIVQGIAGGTKIGAGNPRQCASIASVRKVRR